LLKKKFLLVVFILGLILSGCQQDEKNVVVIDITDEEMESITESIDNLPERVAPPLPKPVIQDELIQVGIITGETIQSLRIPIENFTNESQMKGLEVKLIEEREDLLKQMVEGKISAAIVSADLAAAMYNGSDGNVKIVGQNVDTAIQLIENGQDISAFTDLKGKNIYYSNEAMPATQILRVILQRNRIKRVNEKDFVEVPNYAELLKGIASTPKALGIVVDDTALAATMKSENIRIALNLTEEWKSVTETSLLPVRCLVIQKDISEAQVKRLHVFLTNEDLQVSWRTPKGYEKDILTFMRLMNRLSPDLIGGEVPDEDIFFKWKPVE